MLRLEHRSDQSNIDIELVPKHNFMIRSIRIGTLSCRNIQFLRFEISVC